MHNENSSTILKSKKDRQVNYDVLKDIQSCSNSIDHYEDTTGFSLFNG